MKQMSKSLQQTQNIEETANDLRNFVKDAQRKLIEFEVVIGMTEIKQGKTHAYTSVDELIIDVN
jgi:hypothetical protein